LDNLRPLPAGLSGAVTTETTLNPLETKASKEATAKSGVPMKTIRIAKIFGCKGNIKREG